MDKIKIWLRTRRFWGFAAGYFGVMMAVYFFLWNIMEPIGLPENLSTVPILKDLSTRFVLHCALTALGASVVTFFILYALFGSELDIYRELFSMKTRMLSSLKDALENIRTEAEANSHQGATYPPSDYKNDILREQVTFRAKIALFKNLAERCEPECIQLLVMFEDEIGRALNEIANALEGPAWDLNAKTSFQTKAHLALLAIEKCRAECERCKRKRGYG